MKISKNYEDYGIYLNHISDEDKVELKSPHEIVLEYIKSSVNQKFPEGVPIKILRVLNNISKRFHAAKKMAESEIRLNEDEVTFVRDYYKDALFSIDNMEGALATYDAIFTETH